MELTHGHLLGGRIRYAQPQDGYRTGLEPVLLAASVPARPGECVLEGGTGAGAGLLCLAARVPTVGGWGIELDPEMAALARCNLRDNQMDGIEIVAGDVMQAKVGPVRHAFANPPWHDPRATPSPSKRRRLAKQRPGPDAAAWIGALADAVEDGGTVTVIVPAASEVAVRAAMVRAGLGAVAALRLRPHSDRPAKLLVLQGRASGPETLGELVLHRPGGGFSAEAEAVLREGAATVLATISAI